MLLQEERDLDCMYSNRSLEFTQLWLTILGVSINITVPMIAYMLPSHMTDDTIVARTGVPFRST
jgi:hypothetical protein